MPTEREIAAAKGAPAVGLLGGLLVAGVVYGLSTIDLLGGELLPVYLGVVLVPLSLGLFYQAQFVFRHPAVAVEHDIEPPSKRDVSYETERGAKLTAVLTGGAGVFGLAIVWAIATLPR